MQRPRLAALIAFAVVLLGVAILAYRSVIPGLSSARQKPRPPKAFDLFHERSFLRRAEMVQRLADPDHVKWTLPSIDCLDEILTT